MASRIAIELIVFVILGTPLILTGLALAKIKLGQAPNGNDEKTEIALGLYCNVAASLGPIMLLASEGLKNQSSTIFCHLLCSLTPLLAAPIGLVLLWRYAAGWIRSTGMLVSIIALGVGSLFLLAGLSGA